MRRFALLVLALGFSLPLLASAPAHAQATRTWVSGVGDDVNPCSRTAPCKTFAGAISKTAANGEINCLDPAGYGAVTITKSINIDCTGTLGSILSAGTTGVIVNITSATDTFKTARLRGIVINGGSTNARLAVHGVSIFAATAVYIEDVLITDHAQNGIRDVRTTRGRLHIRNSVIRNSTGVGILATATGAGNDRVTIENVHSVGNGFGIAAATGNQTEITRSVFSHNTSTGIHADAGAVIGVDSTSASHNGTGLAGAGIRFSNSQVSFNGTALTGPPSSYGNNRIHDNTSVGSAPTPLAQQ